MLSIKKNVCNILLVVVTGWYSLSGCNDKPLPTQKEQKPVISLVSYNDSLVDDARDLIRNGDLVLRTGIDYSSEEIKTISPIDKTYSHGGIAVLENNDLFVYHIEPDYYHIRDKVRKESIDSFCNPARNYGIAIARYHLNIEQQQRFIDYLELQYLKTIPFDGNFKLESDDSLYCSEMIRKGLAKSTGNRIQIPTYRFNDKSKFKIIKQYLKLKEEDFINREIIPIDHLFLNPHCTVLKRYLYLH